MESLVLHLLTSFSGNANLSNRSPDVCRAFAPFGLPVFIFAWALLAQLETPAAEPAPPGNPSRAVADGNLGVLLEGFDSENFATRHRARARLSQLLGDKLQGAALADAVYRILLDPASSVELRVQLQATLEQFPDLDPPAPPLDLAADEIAATIGLLNGDTDRARSAAEARLRWYVAEPKLACRMLAPLKAALADPLTTRNAPTDGEESVKQGSPPVVDR